jgi:hypothetical protein
MSDGQITNGQRAAHAGTASTPCAVIGRAPGIKQTGGSTDDGAR